MEKAVTAIPQVARTIAHAIQTRLSGKPEEPPPASQERPVASFVEMEDFRGADLPDTYGRNRLVMLVVDPRQVHAYWEVTPEKLAEAKEAAGSLSAVLRFHDAPAGLGAPGLPAGYFDVAVDLKPRNWYVHLWSPDKSYYAELGLKSETGQFVALAKSNLFHTPRAWPVMQVEEHFLRVDSLPSLAEPVSAPAFLRPHRERPAASGGGPVPSMEPSVAQVPELSLPTFDVRPPARIDSEAIMKGKLSELYPHRPLPRGQSQSRRAASAPALDPDLTGLAEKQFAPGIFSHAPGRTSGET